MSTTKFYATVILILFPLHELIIIKALPLYHLDPNSNSSTVKKFKIAFIFSKYIFTTVTTSVWYSKEREKCWIQCLNNAELDF